MVSNEILARAELFLTDSTAESLLASMRPLVQDVRAVPIKGTRAALAFVFALLGVVSRVVVARQLLFALEGEIALLTFVRLIA